MLELVTLRCPQEACTGSGAGCGSPCWADSAKAELSGLQSWEPRVRDMGAVRTPIDRSLVSGGWAVCLLRKNRTFKVLCNGPLSLDVGEGTLCSSLAWARLLQGLRVPEALFPRPHTSFVQTAGPE